MVVVIGFLVYLSWCSVFMRGCISTSFVRVLGVDYRRLIHDCFELVLVEVLLHILVTFSDFWLHDIMACIWKCLWALSLSVYICMYVSCQRNLFCKILWASWIKIRKSICMLWDEISYVILFLPYPPGQSLWFWWTSN